MDLGAYQVGRELGRGGMGVVLEGRAPDGRRVAIKVLLRQGSSDAADRFQREVRLLASAGEGFVPLLDSGTSPRGPFLVMPFLGGGTLRARLENGPLGIDETVALGRALATALGRVHASGIVHRDLKPENVLFTDEGRPLVADLGLAKHFDAGAPGASQTVALSKSGDLKGTAGYAAPEQMSDAKRVGPPADVFALGAILYECLAGVPAFRGGSIHETFGRALEARFEPLRRVRPDVPRWLAATVERALAKDPARRFADGSELALALEARTEPGRSRAPLALVLGLVVLVGGALGVAATMNRGERAIAPPEVAKNPPPPSTLPPLPEGIPEWCRPILETPQWRLDAVFGEREDRFDEYLNSFAAAGEVGLATELDGTVACVALATGEVRWAVRAHPGGASGASLSRDGKRGASAGSDRTVCVWDVARGTELHRFSIPSTAWGTALSADGSRVAVACDDDRVRVFDVSGRVLAFERAAVMNVASVAFLADGRLVSGGRDGVVRTWSPEGKLLASFPAHQEGISALAVSSDGRLVATGAWNGLAAVWNLAQGTGVGGLPGHGAEIRSLAFVPGPSGAPDELVLTGCGDLHVRAFARNGAPAKDVSADTVVHGFGVVAGGSSVVAGGGEGRLHRLSLPDLVETAPRAGHLAGVSGVAVIPGQGRVVSAARDRTVRIWNVKTRAEEARLAAPGGAHRLALSPDGRRAVTGSADRASFVFDVSEKRLIAKLEGQHSSWVVASACSLDGRFIATGGSDGQIFVWDGAQSEQVVGLPNGHSGDVTGLAFAPDGRQLYSCGLDGKVRVATLDGFTPSGTLLEGAGRLFALLAPPRSSLLFTAGEAKEVIVLEREKSLELGRLRGHRDLVRSLAASADGKLVASGSLDRTVVFWDAAKRVAIDRLDLGAVLDRADALALSPDGRELAIGTGRGVVLHYGRKP